MARHILVTLDTYGRSERVLARVRLLARHFHSTVHLLMVSPRERESVSPPEQPAVASIDWLTHKYLHDVATCLQQEGIEVRMVIRGGEPVETILAVAREVGADVIAMTMPWRTGEALSEARNITEQVIRRAPLPVLVERPHVTTVRVKRSM
jgi:nucleotide-binding universal stress UspA family protein